MKLSELKYSQLTEDEKYEIVMNGITDLSQLEVDDESKADLIVVLGCSPIPLEARIKKMMQLFQKGYSKNILLTGGDGWQKLYKKEDPKTGEIIIDEVRKKELIEAIRQTISANLLGDNPSEKQLALYERFNEGMKELMHTDVPSFDKSQEDKLSKLDEAEFMKLMILSNGGLQGARIFHEPFSIDTKQNIRNTKKLIDGLIARGELKRASRIIVVTSSFHCRRAMLTFIKHFTLLSIIPCPATLDLERRGVRLGREMLSNPYYKKQIENECQAMIKYARPQKNIAERRFEDSFIYDADLSEILPNEISESISKHQSKKEIE